MALLAVTRERSAGEPRVAAGPETVKELIAAGFSVTVEAGLDLDNEGAFAPDDEDEDESLKAALATQGGAIAHPALKRADDAAARPRAR